MPKQILLVEDSVTMQKVVQIAFAREDYEVRTATSADEALSRLREVRPDIVVADAGLTGKSGYDLAAAVKAESSDQRRASAACLPATSTLMTKRAVSAAAWMPFSSSRLIPSR